LEVRGYLKCLKFGILYEEYIPALKEISHFSYYFLCLIGEDEYTMIPNLDPRLTIQWHNGLGRIASLPSSELM
tara:strand:+ start:396 stop:614 length:219 start_codon:yes stop_codon:yes gene_type:complete